MKRFFPHPLMWFALLVMWLLLNQSVSLGHILLGGAVSVLALQGLAALKPEPVKIRFTLSIFKLIGVVLYDIIRSNIAVGKIVTSPGNDRIGSGFITLPMDMTSPYGLSILSTILTATPGTLWMQYDPSRNALMIHVLDLVDEGYWVNLIKSRYETLLMDIFE
ncbi:Na+/H+ antiporter subunit E [Parasphingorhabdus sp.]|uniref:Na+/H+ antiporter subunit E n=1 Tax=Parasphingorhabdus sp. TaxID=2709688 RepID=UPI002F93A976